MSELLRFHISLRKPRFPSYPTELSPFIHIALKQGSSQKCMEPCLCSKHWCVKLIFRVVKGCQWEYYALAVRLSVFCQKGVYVSRRKS